MTDHNTQKRQEWLASLQRDPDNSPWWWAIGAAGVVTLFMLVNSVGPVVFPAG